MVAIAKPTVDLCPDCSEPFGTIACEHFTRTASRVDAMRNALTRGDKALALAMARAILRESDWYAHLERLSEQDPDLAGDLVAALTATNRPRGGA